MRHDIAIIVVATICTILTRTLPFLLFGKRKEPPHMVKFLGHVLPPAVMSILVVYCLKGMQFTALPGFAPMLMAVAFTALVHYKGKNTLLSISGGTAVYMVLIRLIV